MKNMLTTRKFAEVAGGTVVILAMIVAPRFVSAQNFSSSIVGDGWEAFRGVEYLGGDGTLRRKMMGAVVLTDSTIGFYECQVSGCFESKGKPPFKGAPLILIPLRGVTDVVSAAQVRENGSLGSAVFGKDAKEESVAIPYESTNNAEAPVFKTQPAQSMALVAKINFRRKKLGITVKP